MSEMLLPGSIPESENPRQTCQIFSSWVYISFNNFILKIGKPMDRKKSPTPSVRTSGSLKHASPWGDPLSCVSFRPALHDWCNKGCDMCYPVCGMVHIKDPVLLIEKHSPRSGSGRFPYMYMERDVAPWQCVPS